MEDDDGREARVTSATGRPLDGMRVVEGTAFVAAPSGGMTLAQLGADVVRFDQIGGGIDHRRWPLTDDGVSLYWNGLNRGKRSVAVDLRDPEVEDLLTELVVDAGNFLTNFPPTGWMDPESLRARRDDLVMVVVTGSHDGTTALDYPVNCAVGYPDMTGHPDDSRPVNNVVPAWDLVCGQMAAVGLLAADRRRLLGGGGEVVTIALADVALATVGSLGNLAEAQINGEVRGRVGNAIYGAFGRDFTTGDGRRAMVVAISPKQWRGLQAATGTADEVAALADELGVDFADEGERFRATDRLCNLFSPWFAARTLAEVAKDLDSHGVCWGPYRTVAEMVAEDPRCSVANPLFAELDQPGVGRHLVPGSPLAFATAGSDRSAVTAPLLGQHTEEVLVGDLGLSPAAFGTLVDRGAVAVASV
ncbi:MAG: CoA transferase [Actinomycetota bacterium]|nr:CoA transferase [Actinomycetota bacterium]